MFGRVSVGGLIIVMAYANDMTGCKRSRLWHNRHILSGWFD